MPAPLVAGGTYRLSPAASAGQGVTKDGVTWDLSSATVTLCLVKPDGTAVEKSATVTDGPRGQASYTTTTSDLDTPGVWRRSWKIVDGDVTLETPPIRFSVVDSP